jgi:putative transposase
MTQSTQGATVTELCGLACLPRSGFYRRFEAKAPAKADTQLRHLIHAISLKHRFYGYRRVTAALRRQGFEGTREVNRKRVQRLMREDNLLALRAKPFVPHTTQSRHGFTVVPNLIHGLKPSGCDQIWVADITYVRLQETFVYLAVVLDAFSRKAVGFAIAAHLEASLAIAALDMAIAARRPRPGSLIHHSGRGVQYASGDYAKRLSTHGIAASMSRVANPYDNAQAESFMKTLKTEEASLETYTTIEDARRGLSHFIEEVYNKERLHSALGYKPPIEFETQLAQAQLT